ncbi:hypothetical protein CIE53_05315 [Salmonella enterica subsp. enterica serovar Newport]|nr:hypothetical protein [Salmonella enterica]EDK2404065.1 hypothetical protein [Salmonella enterica subsp. enterica serovar Newport]EGP8905137.1 hypothetical protein [Salmonella enterica]
MTTNNHPAHGPVSLERLHQISEILSKAAAQSDGGNLGYAMADAVKVIDGAIAVFGAEPVAWVRYCSDGTIDGPLLNYQIDDCRKSTWTPLYAAPQLPQLPQLPQSAPVVPEEMYWQDAPVEGSTRSAAYATGWNACRAAMLQCADSNSPVIPDCWCRTCRPVTMSDMRFVVCPDCGNKRCPHANDHKNACTGSNEPGQVGSAYPAAPQQEVNRG